jgi:hypothetical protein
VGPIGAPRRRQGLASGETIFYAIIEKKRKTILASYSHDIVPNFQITNCDMPVVLLLLIYSLEIPTVGRGDAKMEWLSQCVCG